MKVKILVLGLAVAFGVTISSCSTSRGGCKMSQGLVGYGNTR